MSINSFSNLVTFCTRDLRDSRDMAFFDDIFWKLLSGLLLPENDWFSISAIFFVKRLMAAI